MSVFFFLKRKFGHRDRHLEEMQCKERRKPPPEAKECLRPPEARREAWDIIPHSSQKE